MHTNHPINLKPSPIDFWKFPYIWTPETGQLLEKHWVYVNLARSSRKKVLKSNIIGNKMFNIADNSIFK